MAQNVRVRFAPSPTGPLHIGGVRTALFNYLFAKKHNGTFILRIEDTDRSRFVPGAEDYIIESLNWLEIPYDEGPGKDGGFGPYRQSERKAIYRQYADYLIDNEFAYYAFDTQDELSSMRAEHESRGETFIYNWHNRNKLNNSLNISDDAARAKINSGEEFVIRFKSPENETVVLHDIIRGEISVDSNTLDDKILFKSDGMPTYHLANIVDDHLMQISHVIRGEEWLPSLALHVLLYRSFEWDTPKFAHLPLIMNPGGKGKLSKRHGDQLGFPVFPLEWRPDEETHFSGYREEGYLPEAVINMLAFLGWNPGTEKEIFSLNELIDEFDLSIVQRGGANFDPEKAKWFQNHYFQEAPAEQLLPDFKSVLENNGVTPPKDLLTIVGLMKERASFVSELWDQSSFFFLPPDSYDEKASKKAFKEGTKELLEELKSRLEEMNSFDSTNVSETVKTWLSESEIGFGKVMMPFRLALVGEMKGPEVFEIAAILGKDESIKRIQAAIDHIG